MKKIMPSVITVILLVSFSAVVAQQKYSGIYSAKFDGVKLLAAVTVGGRILALSEYSEGLRDALNPAKSTVNSSGKVKGVTPNGTSTTASINSSFEIKGTVKAGTQSVRLSGKRTLK